MTMHVLCTGADGYIGSLLGPYLLQRGIKVIGLDTGDYHSGWLYPTSAPRPLVISKDFPDITVEDLQGFDAIAHLAELSNDPLGQQDPALTHEINHVGSVHLANLARKAGVRRFVYTSSCSVYGVGKPDQTLDENSEVNLQTAYAECKVKVENDLSDMAGDDFEPYFLRNATAYGAPPRQRINVGSIEQNYRVREIAEIVAREFPGCTLTVGAPSADNRSYRVSFDKIGRILPDFKCQWTAELGAHQMRQVFERIAMTEDDFRAAPYTRLKMLMKLCGANLLDDRLYWKKPRT